MYATFAMLLFYAGFTSTDGIPTGFDSSGARCHRSRRARSEPAPG